MASALFAGEASNAQWGKWLAAYEDAIAKVVSSKSSDELLGLDKWLRSEWPQKSRKPAGLETSDLEKIARWKLSRGHWRPLLPRIQSNSAAVVAAAWKAACASFATHSSSSGDEVSGPCSAVAALAKLDGVGPATASAILAPCHENAPFMSDEALLAAGCPLKYDFKTYRKLVEALAGKAASLGGDWTAERVGRALWACTVLGGNACGGVKRPAKDSMAPVCKRPARSSQ
eukprot:TRINITY_DN76007_c0_g1_i1.p1 TRINITY_DN76007_c0_g1~~TRINITY_DN76007_c0_g1_i1.p1  ORF type:complete len:230 (-),score=42.33 TRINITY_DN76007_c0_g1_i1:17-706(-)